jgi:hypothetical protein
LSSAFPGFTTDWPTERSTSATRAYLLWSTASGEASTFSMCAIAANWLAGRLLYWWIGDWWIGGSGTKYDVLSTAVARWVFVFGKCAVSCKLSEVFKHFPP